MKTIKIKDSKANNLEELKKSQDKSAPPKERNNLKSDSGHQSARHNSSREYRLLPEGATVGTIHSKRELKTFKQRRLKTETSQRKGSPPQSLSNINYHTASYLRSSVIPTSQRKGVGIIPDSNATQRPKIYQGYILPNSFSNRIFEQRIPANQQFMAIRRSSKQLLDKKLKTITSNYKKNQKNGEERPAMVDSLGFSKTARSHKKGAVWGSSARQFYNSSTARGEPLMRNTLGEGLGVGKFGSEKKLKQGKFTGKRSGSKISRQNSKISRQNSKISRRNSKMKEPSDRSAISRQKFPIMSPDKKLTWAHQRKVKFASRKIGAAGSAPRKLKKTKNYTKLKKQLFSIFPSPGGDLIPDQGSPTSFGPNINMAIGSDRSIISNLKKLPQNFTFDIPVTNGPELDIHNQNVHSSHQLTDFMNKKHSHFDFNKKLDEVEFIKKDLLNVLTGMNKRSYSKPLLPNVNQINSIMFGLHRDLRSWGYLGVALSAEQVLKKFKSLLLCFLDCVIKVRDFKKLTVIDNKKKSRVGDELQKKLDNRLKVLKRAIETDKDKTYILEESFKETQNLDNTFERVQLRHATERLNKEIEKYDKFLNDSQHAKEHLEDTKGEITDLKLRLAKNIEENSATNLRIKYYVDGLLVQQKALEGENEGLRKKLGSMNLTENASKIRLDMVKRERDRFREVAMMQLEEMDGFRLKQKALLADVKDLREQLVTKKLDKTETAAAQLMNIQEMREEQEDVIAHILKIFSEDFDLLRKRMARDFAKVKTQEQRIEDNLDFTFQRFSLENFVVQQKMAREAATPKESRLRGVGFSRRTTQSFNKSLSIKGKDFLGRIDLSRLRLYKPSLFMLVKFRLDSLNKEDVKELINKDFNFLGLLRVVRAIMDSKWREMTLCSVGTGFDPKRISNFVDFVYSWLGNFCVDVVKRRITRVGFLHQSKLKEVQICYSVFKIHLKFFQI